MAAEPTYFDQMEALAASQGGYFYPWRSTLGGGDGESGFTAMVEAHLRPDARVLEPGCGHGPDILAFAPKVARYLAYDAAEGFIALARQGVAAAGLANVELIHANSSAGANGGRVRIPAADGSVDLIVSRRGPTNWIADARRAARPGAALIQLNPMAAPPPAWDGKLPPGLRAPPPPEPIEARIGALLAGAGIALHSAWTFDVPEWLASPRDTYACLAFLRLDAPPLGEALPALEAIFREHAAPQGLEIRQRRYLWKAIV